VHNINLQATFFLQIQHFSKTTLGNITYVCQKKDKMIKGKLISTDSKAGSGKIIDENEQDIHCCLKDLGTAIKIGEEIFFDIEMTSYGLTAVNIFRNKELNHDLSLQHL